MSKNTYVFKKEGICTDSEKMNITVRGAQIKPLALLLCVLMGKREDDFIHCFPFFLFKPLGP